MGTHDAERVHRLVRRAVQCARSQGGSAAAGAAAEAPVRAALRTACAAARARAMRVERLLILLKAVWWQKAAARPATRPGARQDEHEALARVVTLCIEEYYAAPAPGGRARDGPTFHPEDSNGRDPHRTQGE